MKTLKYILPFIFLINFLSFLCGCGIKGDPLPPKGHGKILGEDASGSSTDDKK